MVLARICTTVVFMTYPVCLSVLPGAWQMSATRGGIVQGGLTGAFALFLLIASLLCDRVGAKRVFDWTTLLSRWQPSPPSSRRRRPDGMAAIPGNRFRAHFGHEPG